jgi:hypothetical protein
MITRIGDREEVGRRKEEVGIRKQVAWLAK